MQRKSIIALTVSALCMSGIFAISSCKKDNHIDVEAVKFSAATKTVKAGGTVNLNVMILPSDAEYTGISVSSSDSSVAVAANTDKSVQVTGIKSGEATITVAVDAVTSTCHITVTPYGTVELDTNEMHIGVGSVLVLSATVTPAEGTIVKWGSRNDAVASVSYEGTRGSVKGNAAGETVIYCMANDDDGFKDSCKVVVVGSPVYPESPDAAPVYINGIWWAPVNCGYDKVNYKYGKLYQWGRADGCGYLEKGKFEETVIQTVAQGPVDENKEAADKFYVVNTEWAFNWLKTPNPARWNSGTEEAPVKTKFDPCPDGWRVPTHAELKSLTGGAGITEGFAFQTKDGQNGHWFDGKNEAAAEGSGIFLPAAGCRYYDSTCYHRGTSGSYFSSTYIDEGNGAETMMIYDHGVYLNDAGAFSNASSVRCVRE